eukprot:SAG11_NODE_9529_length_903_cov_0.893035_1_plen_38_part_10
MYLRYLGTLGTRYSCTAVPGTAVRPYARGVGMDRATLL